MLADMKVPRSFVAVVASGGAIYAIGTEVDPGADSQAPRVDPGSGRPDLKGRSKAEFVSPRPVPPKRMIKA